MEYVYILSIYTLTDIFLEEYIINYKQQLPVSVVELKKEVGGGKKQWKKHYSCIFALFKMCTKLLIYLVMAI